MAKVFLSHSSSDKEIVRKIAKQLGNKNSVLDEFTFEAGQQTLDEIFKHLDNSDLFVIFLSDNSLNSKWVKAELGKAKKNLKSEELSRILPIIIDKNITYKDERIPNWLAKPYNLKYFPNEVIILQKIRKSLREINFKKTRFNQELENNFVGRNTEMQKFEDDINNLDNWTPTYIIAYNYFEGIGRRTFLKNALRKNEFIDYLDVPATITIDAKESIENFIYKLNTISKEDEILKYDFSEESIENKVEIATKLVKQFMDFKELIFIIDEGGIILPNNTLVDWFSEIVNNEIFNNNLIFCLISKYRPNEIILKREGKSLIYRIPELSKPETKNLFQKLLKIYQLENLNREEKEFFISNLNGIPSQIIYAVNLIGIDPLTAKKNINDIVQFSDTFSSTILSNLKSDEIAYQICIFLSQNEIFSVDLINKVFGEQETAEGLQKLYDLSLFNFVFGSFDYVKLNSTLTDYINRSKLRLDSKYSESLNNIIKVLLKQDLNTLVLEDYSEFLLTIQKMLEDGKSIPKKYFIPSLIIKNVIKEYDKGNYEYVIKICLELLQNNNYDSQIIWETKYRLTLAYARTRNTLFFDHISFFKNDINNLDYFFLLGFYHRNSGNKTKALDYYYKALEIYPEHSRTKREIVNILLNQHKYADALELAKENYESRKTNIFHIHSYFTCLIRKKTVFSNDKKKIDELFTAVKNSYDIKSSDIFRCMHGEYEFFINNSFEKAHEILLEALRLNENKTFPKKTLIEIYRAKGKFESITELEKLNVDSFEEDL